MFTLKDSLLVSTFVLLGGTCAANCVEVAPSIVDDMATDQWVTQYYSKSVEELWDDVIVVLAQKVEIQFVSFERGLLIAGPYVVQIAVKPGRTDATLLLGYIMPKEERDEEDADQQRAIALEILGTQIGTQAKTKIGRNLTK